MSLQDLSVGLLPRPEALPPQSHPDAVQPGACHETPFRTVVPRRLHDEGVRSPCFQRDQVPGGDGDLGLGECSEEVKQGLMIFFSVISFCKQNVFFAMVCNEYQISQYFIPHEKVTISVYFDRTRRKYIPFW